MARSDLSRKIEQAADYVQMVNILLKELKLPDPSKRQGLKRFATNYPQYSRKINACYDAHNQSAHKNYLVLAAIVNLWGKLAVDMVLRDRIIADGIIERMAVLLQEGPDDTRQSVLFALSNLTHHAGEHARKKIAELTVPTIIDLLDTPHCRARIAELGIAVLSHSMNAAITEGEAHYHEGTEVVIPPALRRIDGVRMLTAVTEAMRRSDVDEELLSHGLDLLRTLAFSYRKPILETSSERPLVATLASPNLNVRLLGFMGLLRLGSTVTEREGRQINPLQIWQISSNMEDYFSPKLMEAMRNQYGGLEGGMIAELAETGMGMGMEALTLGDSGDYLQIGRDLCKTIMEKEYSLGGGFMYGMGADGTYTRAISALRDSKNPADAHLPAVIEIKLAMASGDREGICSLGDAAIQQFPDVGFFYYARSIWTQESRLGLRLAKKGLACAGLTDYVKRGLLFKSAEAGYEMAVDAGPLEISQPGSSAWREGVAILHCAQEDARAYIEMTPIDQKNMKTAIYTYIAITLILEGDQVFKNVDKIRPYVEKLSIAEQIFSIVVRPLPRTQRKLAIDTIIPLFAKPMKNWRTVISRLDKPSRGHHHHSQLGEDDPDHVLANWLARTQFDDENAPQSELADINAPDDDSFGTSAEDVLVYRCSLCGNPSASLRRCAKCKSARYCDDSCQRKHWKKGHKLTCKPA
ncbi:MYND finger protein [Rhizoctonia solani AG-3 Rhs1AP]|uniref:MYND finger protein n=2 Tax=Rhizoctonia solani AG-3 TaxID=1086053 RepID=A0A074RSM8_9AGAM|nr:MYND finger protein [Rhizoctonia solani AG-3 Rhs1AP]KEP49869.1 MYND finger protein [Rhizoctonia solani 123E]